MMETEEQLVRNTVAAEVKYINYMLSEVLLENSDSRPEWLEYLTNVENVVFQSGFPYQVIWPVSPIHYTRFQLKVERI
jgi:adenine-specific DNA methylase